MYNLFEMDAKIYNPTDCEIWSAIRFLMVKNKSVVKIKKICDACRLYSMCKCKKTGEDFSKEEECSRWETHGVTLL